MEGLEVRIIEYALPNMPESEARYRLMTTLPDPGVARARDLAALYHDRWHVESVFDELQTHLRQSRRVLRSKTPELVRQEFYGVYESPLKSVVNCKPSHVAMMNMRTAGNAEKHVYSTQQKFFVWHTGDLQEICCQVQRGS